MDKYYKYYFYVTEHGTMQIYDKQNRIVAEISGCENMKQKELNRLFEETIDNLGGVLI